MYLIEYKRPFGRSTSEFVENSQREAFIASRERLGFRVVSAVNVGATTGALPSLTLAY